MTQMCALESIDLTSVQSAAAVDLLETDVGQAVVSITFYALSLCLRRDLRNVNANVIFERFFDNHHRYLSDGIFSQFTVSSLKLDGLPTGRLNQSIVFFSVQSILT